MRQARGPNGEELFAVTEILSAQQISSFFSRLAAKQYDLCALVKSKEI